MDSDVIDLTSSIGWTGTVGTDEVSWAAGTGLIPGSSATFSFTTEPREVGNATLEATGGGGFFADLPVAPAPREKAQSPVVALSFTDNTHNHTLNLNMGVAEGTGLASGSMPVDAPNATTARDYVYAFLVDNGWAVEKAGDSGITITGTSTGNAPSNRPPHLRGKKLQNGTIVAVTSLTSTVTNRATGTGTASATGIGPVTVTNN